MASIFDSLKKKLSANLNAKRSAMPVPVAHPVRGVPQRHVGFMAFNDASGVPASGTALEHARGIITKK